MSFLVFLNRSKRNRYALSFRVAAFTVGAVLGLGGIYLDSVLLRYLAIAALVAGIIPGAIRRRVMVEIDEDEDEDWTSDTEGEN